MTELERFKEVMDNFNTGVSAPKWEFGYWGQTVENWYDEGLPKIRHPEIDIKISTPTSSLYVPCWRSITGGKLPAGIAVLGGGLYHPTQGFVPDYDVRTALGMDKGQRLVDVNLLFDPVFDVNILEEDEEFLTYIDLDGVTRKFAKKTGVIPMALKHVISDRRSWEQIKAERLSKKDIRSRFPSNWPKLVKEYKDRDYPLVLGGYPHGIFGTLAHLMGYEELFYAYSDAPDLIHDISRTFTDIWLAVYEEVLGQTSVDMVVIWEDMSAGTGSMVSPSMIREFMIPYYKKLTGFFKQHGVNTIFIDTDGYCFDLIPLYMEGGITGMYPIEATCGMDVVRIRKEFPALKMMGGIPKSEIQYGTKRIDEILEPVEEAYRIGGYIPFGDHLVPPEVHWKEFKYYRERLNAIIDGE